MCPSLNIDRNLIPGAFKQLKLQFIFFQWKAELLVDGVINHEEKLKNEPLIHNDVKLYLSWSNPDPADVAIRNLEYSNRGLTAINLLSLT